mmetsp:Transcript_14817/g.24717  ORF Transcript_14817/g.24717 Transcript_14817/m.24717 type:complete len:637 (-) Transcript_14817:162-2072(-)|eukprot:CAMPEP_0119331126 /NCGR_PEP_ID=MMETSP1333-20130426/79857_1 /TAXON_ID=418940 /ORGANISM="Scyphosphaera apsteinii, Strain RCC1455" /LENGTH=636 /DNA_ID=CAMNT_0007340653 /DNA_START=123 /DNA_END=2033 /DNA_ORIENTATION=+
MEDFASGNADGFHLVNWDMIADTSAAPFIGVLILVGALVTGGILLATGLACGIISKDLQSTSGRFLLVAQHIPGAALGVADIILDLSVLGIFVRSGEPWFTFLTATFLIMSGLSQVYLGLVMDNDWVGVQGSVDRLYFSDQPLTFVCSCIASLCGLRLPIEATRVVYRVGWQGKLSSSDEVHCLHSGAYEKALRVAKANEASFEAMPMIALQAYVAFERLEVERQPLEPQLLLSIIGSLVTVGTGFGLGLTEEDGAFYEPVRLLAVLSCAAQAASRLSLLILLAFEFGPTVVVAYGVLSVAVTARYVFTQHLLTGLRAPWNESHRLAALAHLLALLPIHLLVIGSTSADGLDDPLPYDGGASYASSRLIEPRATGLQVLRLVEGGGCLVAVLLSKSYHGRSEVPVEVGLACVGLLGLVAALHLLMHALVSAHGCYDYCVCCQEPAEDAPETMLPRPALVFLVSGDVAAGEKENLCRLYGERYGMGPCCSRAEAAGFACQSMTYSHATKKTQAETRALRPSSPSTLQASAATSCVNLSSISNVAVKPPSPPQAPPAIPAWTTMSGAPVAGSLHTIPSNTMSLPPPLPPLSQPPLPTNSGHTAPLVATGKKPPRPPPLPTPTPPPLPVALTIDRATRV